MKRVFTVETALQYAKEGNIEEWIRQYLTESDRPNPELLNRIKERKGFWCGPVEVPIYSLVKWAIPNPDRVCELAQNIEDAYSVTPLIIHSRIHKEEIPGPSPHTVFRHKLEIADGNHRHAVFEKKQWPSCWVLIELGTEHDE